jgi:serine/threonine-protein kinase
VSPAAHWRGATRRFLPHLIAAIGGFLAAYLVVFFFVFPSELLPTEAKVPNVVGLGFEDAARRLDAAGFRHKLGETRYHVTAPKRSVLGQTPPPGSVEAHGAEIVLDVSAGQRSAVVPSVVGLTQQRAQVLIENAGFDLGDVTQQRGNTPRGQVLSSSPAAGQTVTIPSTIALVVSGGPATVTVPDLIGLTIAEARSTLEQLGITLGPPRVDSAALEPPNTITGQTPNGGNTVPAGSVVRVTVSGRAP